MSEANHDKRAAVLAEKCCQDSFDWMLPQDIPVFKKGFTAGIESEEVRGLVAAIEKAEQLADIASDWNLDEVQIDGEMMDIYTVKDIFTNALAKYQGTAEKESG